MIRRKLKPGIRLVFDRPGGDARFRQVFPFRKSWVAIGVLLALDAVFLIPAAGALSQAADHWGRFDSLFDLVTALFLSAWLLGWSLAPLLITGVLVVLLLGREVITVWPGLVRLFIGLPFVGVAVDYEPSKMRNLRLVDPPPKSGTSWRGPHFEFDYGSDVGQFGSALDPVRAARLRGRMEMAAGVTFRSGPPSPEDVADDHASAPPAPEMLPIAAQPPLDAGSASPISLASPSALLLIAANLVPVAGTIFADWRLSDVMVLYWAETAVIGLFNVFKMIVIGRWKALFAGPFFVGHFGGFMAVHFLFIYGLFVEGPNATTDGDLGDVARLFYDLWPALLALFVSHAWSFFANFIGRREYRGRTISTQMGEPYSRVVLMHVTLIFGGFVTMLLGEPAPVILAVIVIKVLLDMRAHLREHRGEADDQRVDAAPVAERG